MNDFTVDNILYNQRDYLNRHDWVISPCCGCDRRMIYGFDKHDVLIKFCIICQFEMNEE